jgi:hypothetical protein
MRWVTKIDDTSSRSRSFERQLTDRPRRDRIESGRRFIVKDYLRVSDQRPRNANPAPHATGELVRHLGAQHPRDRRSEASARRPARSLLGDILLAQAIGDVIIDVEAVEERSLLEDHPDLAPDPHHLLFGPVGDLLTIDKDLSGSPA